MTYKEELEKLRQKKQLASEKEASATKEHLEKLRGRRDGLLEHLKLQTADLVGVQVDLNESTGTITLRAPPSPNYICINVDWIDIVSTRPQEQIPPKPQARKTLVPAMT